MRRHAAETRGCVPLVVSSCPIRRSHILESAERMSVTVCLAMCRGRKVCMKKSITPKKLLLTRDTLKVLDVRRLSIQVDSWIFDIQ